MATPLLKQLRPLRLRLGLTQEDVAQDIGVTRSFIAQLESGTRQGLETTKLVRMAQSLGVSVDVLFADQLDDSIRDIDTEPNLPTRGDVE
jgi:transcriptional regulator with XRE-family HTH domain